MFIYPLNCITVARRINLMTLFTEPPHLYLTLIFIHACNYLTISQDILSSDYTHLSTNIEFILFSIHADSACN